MQIPFTKYHGTGNDFILINNFDGSINSANIQSHFKEWCHRRFGVGADGVILLGHHKEYDFKMDYYNSDGNESSMCGNGGRCLVHFARWLGIIENQCQFEAVDGLHEASILGEEVTLKMNDVMQVSAYEHDYILNTGSPHYVSFKENVTHLNVRKAGFQIRHSGPFAQEGINVNFAHVSTDGIYVRTYERGVEDETYSCGTGVVAAAIVHGITNEEAKQSIKVKTLGGDLNVSFTKAENRYTDVHLRGPATRVYEGVLEV